MQSLPSDWMRGSLTGVGLMPRSNPHTNLGTEPQVLGDLTRRERWQRGFKDAPSPQTFVAQTCPKAHRDSPYERAETHATALPENRRCAADDARKREGPPAHAKDLLRSPDGI